VTYLALDLNGHIKVRDEELGFSTSFGSHQCFFSQFCYATVTKKEEHPECFQVPCLTPLGPSYVLSEAQSVCYFPDLLQLEGCYARPHNATCDHIDGEYEPHASQHNKQLGP
jgi:hypothetical protein